MTRPKVLEYNAETQEEVLREMNDEEYAQHLIDKEKDAEYMAAEAAKKAEAEAAKAAVEAKLAALGLDLETVKLLAKL